MINKGCSCSDNKSGQVVCPCDGDDQLPYWCETCRQYCRDKRCPGCGLKCRSVSRMGKSILKAG